MIAFPLGDQRIQMRRQRRVELCRIRVAQFDPVAAALFVAGLADRPFRFRVRLGSGFMIGIEFMIGIGFGIGFGRGASFSAVRS